MDNKLNSNVRIVNLSNYVQPTIEETPSKKYVTYGDKNAYFYYLIDRSRGSATNGAVINSIIDLIFGEGLNDESFYDTIPEEDIKRLINDIKRMGQCAIQVQYFGGRKSAKGSHIPVETLAAEKVNKDGDIEAYYYSRDWSKVTSDSDLERIPAFGMSKEGIEILYIKPYSSGMFYYAPPDYNGGLQYAELEEEIGNYHVNNIQNGLAPSMLVNMNNGVPETEEKARQIEKQIQDKYTGSSNAGRIILMFNNPDDKESTVTPVMLSDASEQYQFLSDESMRKILVSHRVTSPLLLGLSTNTGFGSNADELKTASVLFETLVIRPFRERLILEFEKLDKFNNKTRELEFISLNPFVEEVEKEAAEEPDDVELSTDIDLSEFGQTEEDILKDWDLIDERDVDYEMEAYMDMELAELNTPDKTFFKKIWEFVSTGRAMPNAKSEQDETVGDWNYMVRYSYFPNKTGTGKKGNKSRAFCNAMVAANKLYRKEDIVGRDYPSSLGGMSGRAVNAGWGLAGADTYDIFKYKGGGGCHHRWRRKTFRSKTSTRPAGSDTIGTRAAEIRGYTIRNPWEVSVRPVDMPNKGFVNK